MGWQIPAEQRFLQRAIGIVVEEIWNMTRSREVMAGRPEVDEIPPNRMAGHVEWGLCGN